MAGRKESTRSVVRLVVVAALVMSAHATAQQPGGTPPESPPASPLPDPGGPSAGPTAPQATPPVGPGTPAPTAVPQAAEALLVQRATNFAVPRFNIKIAPNTPTKDLLPTPPKVQTPAGPLAGDDLTKVPEAEFQARPEKAAIADGKQPEHHARQLAKINHLNAKKTDAFMSALLENRPDLAGLPFTMGDDCRTSGERTRQFTIAVNTVRQAMQSPLPGAGPGTGSGGDRRGGGPGIPGGFGGPGTLNTPNGGQFGGLGVASPASAADFWKQYAALCEQQDAAQPKTDKSIGEHVTVARLAALMQMLAPESAEHRLGLVKHLTAVPHVEATQALAKLAIFSTEDDVRLAAITSLKVRRERDYTDILVRGLRYPWPAVAKRSADAITRIGRTDLIPELVAVLSESDPRMPVAKTVNGEKVSVVREMVRVNHHRNCMMCHSPGNTGDVSLDAIQAPVPIPGQPFPSPFQGYGSASSPDLMIRVDVTYLRQDFSAMMQVTDASPWPEQQRFDFLVRERKLTGDEADAYREKLTPKEAGVLSPYHRASLAALRELTGKDTAPTAEAWRKLLDLPAKTNAKVSAVRD